MGWLRRRQPGTDQDPHQMLSEHWWKRYGSTMTEEQRARADVTNGILADLLAELLAAVDVTDLAEGLHASGLSSAVDVLSQVTSGKIAVAAAVTYEPNVNVVVRAVRGSYLITMTEPFVWLVEHVGWLVAATATYSDGDRIIEPAVSYDRAATLFARWMEQVLQGDQPAPPQEQLEPGVTNRGMHYFRTAMQFALGHEVGHVVLGHLDGTTVPREDIGVVVPDSMFSRIEELTADQIGARLVSQGYEEAAESQFFGMIIMFELLDAVEMHAIARLDPEAQPVSRRARALATHPHPALRRSTAIRTGLPLDIGDFSLPMCDALLTQCDQITGHDLPRRDGPALQQIEDLYDSSRRDELMEIFQMRHGVRGVRTVDTAALWRLLSTDLASATTTLATATHFYLDNLMARTRVVSAHSQLCLAQVHVMYAHLYLLDDAADEARSFEATLNAAVPELDEIVWLFVQTANAPD